MTVYLDAVWVLNLCLNTMLLLLTKKLAKDSTKTTRILFGAFIASLIVPITLFDPHHFFSTVIGKFLYSILIILCAFQFKSMYRLGKQLLLFYFVTFAVGGGLTALHFMLQSPIRLSNKGMLTFHSGYGDPVSWLFIVIGFPIVWLFTKDRLDKHAIEKIRYEQMYPVTIHMKKKSFSTMGYIDSGNQLVDPLTKKPVIICDKPFLRQWFTEKEWQQLEVAHTHLQLDQLPTEWKHSIQIVPYQGVEGKSQFLFAIKPEQLTVYYEGQRIVTSKCLIGIQFSTLTPDESYHCLLHPQIIKFASIHTA